MKAKMSKIEPTPGPWQWRSEAVRKVPYDPKDPYWPLDIARKYIIDSDDRHAMFIAEAWADEDDSDIFAEVEANCQFICDQTNAKELASLKEENKKLSERLDEYRTFCDKLEGAAGRSFNALLRKWYRPAMNAMCEQFKIR
jgi:hypothetical protein